MPDAPDNRRTLWRLILAALLIQPFVFVVEMFVIIFLLGGNSGPGMIARSHLFFAAALLLLILLARKPLWERSLFVTQPIIGLLFAPVYVRLFWSLFVWLK